MQYRFLAVTGILFSVVLTTSQASAATPTLDEMWQMIQDQQQRIEQLEATLLENEQRLEAAQSSLTESRVEISQQNEKLETAAAMLEATVDAVERGTGSASPVSIGGYGELHYNNTDAGDEIDFHRFVLFFGHQFNETLSFYSELEVEHALAGDGAPGEVELEQAFIQWDYAPGQSAKGGLFLLPVGILNETHEPDTFYGVERNSIESQIIPATWWEAGVLFDGELAPGWGYDLAVHSGLNLDTGNANPARRSSIRSSRQKVAKANADSLAYTARLSYSGIPGVRLSTSLQYQSDLTQGDAAGIGIGKIDGMLFETNASVQRGMFGLRALYARWDLDQQIEVLNPGADEQVGWYLEPSLRFDKLGVFARYGSYDLTAGNSATSSERNQLNFGINYWLHEHVVIKADIQRQDNDNGNDVDGFNLGIGYSF